MKKRIFSLLVAICPVAGLLPTVASAAIENYDTIDSGIYDDTVVNKGQIIGGTFNGTANNGGSSEVGHSMAR